MWARLPLLLLLVLPLCLQLMLLLLLWAAEAAPEGLVQRRLLQRAGLRCWR